MADGIRNPDLIRKKERQIALAAAKCMVGKGFNKATVREIAKDAGLTIGNLYDYIKTKEDILYLVYKEIVSEYSDTLLDDESITSMTDPKEQLVASVDVMLDVANQSSDMMILSYRETRFLKRDDLRATLKAESRLVDFFAGIVQRGVDVGVFREVHPHIAADAIILLLVLWPLRGWSIRRHGDIQGSKDFCLDFILNGLLAVKGPAG